MISDTQMRYGSRVFCHGRSCRPCCFCQETRRAANELMSGIALPSPRSSRRAGRLLTIGEALLRFTRRFRGRIFRDDFLERASGAGGVAELDLTAGDIEQCVRDFL